MARLTTICRSMALNAVKAVLLAGLGLFVLSRSGSLAGVSSSYNQGVNSVGLSYFKESEFRGWFGLMDKDLLIKLDLFRHLWGAPVMISPHPDALGRYLGSGSGSYHNVDAHGEVKAVDVFPSGLTPENAERAVKLAEQAGFGGIGVYTDTVPSVMMHLDTGPRGRRWARVSGEYVGIVQAYV